METKKREMSCTLVKEITHVDFNVERGFLNSVKIIFKQPITRKTREDLQKCLAKNKVKTIWGNQMVLIK